MNRRERVIATLNHKETDFLPYQIDFTLKEYKKLESFLHDTDFYNKIGNHMSGTGFGNITEDPARPGYFVDDYGVCWNRTGPDKDIGVLDGIVIPEPNISLYSFPKVDEQEIRRRCVSLLDRRDGTFKTFSIGFSMFERAWTLRGMENFLADMLLEPSFANELLTSICDFNLKILDIAVEYDFDCIYFGDDWGQQSGLIMGPELWRRFVKPQMKRMYEKVKKAGKFVQQHSCGDINQIFPDLIDIGLDIYETFQPEIYDLKQVKKDFGRYLTFFGGISTQKLLPFASPLEVKEKVIETMKIMGSDGGYIISPTHAIPGDVPAENVMAMIEVVQNQEKYFR